MERVDGNERQPPLAGIQTSPPKSRVYPVLELAPQADSGMHVSYYVLESPVVIEGDKLIPSLLPPRTNFPVKVMAVTWQWGRSHEPRIQTADFVEMSFLITAKNK